MLKQMHFGLIDPHNLGTDIAKRLVHLKLQQSSVKLLEKIAHETTPFPS